MPTTKEYVEGFIARKAEGVILFVREFVYHDLVGIFTKCCKNHTPDEIKHVAAATVDKLFKKHKDQMTHRLLILKAYDLYRLQEAENGGIQLPEISTDLMTMEGQHLQHLSSAINFLGVLNEEHLEHLISQAATEIAWDKNFTKKVLGRYVWNNFYQPGKNIIPEAWEIVFH